MTTTPPDNSRPDSNNEPADLSELTATDALLDRLGARSASEDDLRDPAAEILAELLAEIDESREPDVGAARLIEVLAGRPLYIAGAEPASDQLLVDLAPGARQDDAQDGEPQVSRVIDLTDHQDGDRNDHDDQDERDDNAEVGEVAASASPRPPRPTIPVAPSSAPPTVPIPVQGGIAARSWDRTLSQVFLPAASVLMLLALCGGVSAAVTGDPMTPVNGITRVVAQLPGVKDDDLDKVQGEIKLARRAVSTQDTPAAARHLDNARAGLDAVSESDKTDLKEEINKIQVLVPTSTPAATTPGSVATTEAPVPEASTTPEPTDTEPPTVTEEPPAPDPTTDPPEPEPDPEPTDDPTSQQETSATDPTD